MRAALAFAVIVAFAYADRAACALRDCLRMHRSPSPVGTPLVRAKVGISPRSACAVCRERAAVEGDVCDECSIWITALAYTNRDASEHAS